MMSAAQAEGKKSSDADSWGTSCHLSFVLPSLTRSPARLAARMESLLLFPYNVPVYPSDNESPGR
jgi:hypothetical protein